jgi:hypothetical protein
VNDREQQRPPYLPVRCLRCGKGCQPWKDHDCAAEDVRAAGEEAGADRPADPEDPEHRPVKFREFL